jgi:hypothetical protein
MNFFLIGGKNESFWRSLFCCCKIDACNPCYRQPGNHCRRFGGAHSFLSFLEVNYVEHFIFHLGLGDGRLRRRYDYRAWHSDSELQGGLVMAIHYVTTFAVGGIQMERLSVADLSRNDILRETRNSYD